MSLPLPPPPSPSTTPLPSPPTVAMHTSSRVRTRSDEFQEVNVVEDILQPENDDNIPTDNTSQEVANSSKKRFNEIAPGTNRSGVKRLRKDEINKTILSGTDITGEKKRGGVKVLPQGKDVVQLPVSRKGGGPAWTPIPYENAIQMQKDWRKHRWCMDKIANEYIGDRQLLRATGAAAANILEWREKVLPAFTALVGPYLIATSQVRDGKLTGAMVAFSMIDAIIGVAEAEKLKEVIARITTQVHERPGVSWYCNLTLATIAKKMLANV